MFTQPLMYAVIRQHPPVSELYAARLEAQGVIDKGWLQGAIDAWHVARAGQPIEQPAYQAFLREIGYLVPEPKSVKVSTKNVDAELATLAGPQLVVPILNARYALNAANARWGSLYDALYGTDAIDESEGATRSGPYNPIRGARVIAYARHVLDRTAPLKKGSHVGSTGYAVKGGDLVVTLKDGSTSKLADKVKPYVILEVGSEKIGIIGLTTPETVVLSTPGKDIVFDNDLVAVTLRASGDTIG